MHYTLFDDKKSISKKKIEKIRKKWQKTMFLKFFLKVEAGHVLKMFLSFGQIWASRSYKLGSYKKKKRVVGMWMIRCLRFRLF